MSTTLLLAPHADDETLFASYLAQRYAAHIVVVYDEGRETELSQATQWLGCTYTQLRVQKGAGVSDVLEHIRAYERSFTGKLDRVILPDVEDYGHEEHNLIGGVGAVFAWGEVEMIRYRTYSPRGTRSHGTPVEPIRPYCIARKLAALSCYRSQILDPGTRPWFYDLLDMREWVA